MEGIRDAVAACARHDPGHTGLFYRRNPRGSGRRVRAHRRVWSHGRV